MEWILPLAVVDTVATGSVRLEPPPPLLAPNANPSVRLTLVDDLAHAAANVRILHVLCDEDGTVTWRNTYETAAMRHRASLNVQFVQTVRLLRARSHLIDAGHSTVHAITPCDPTPVNIVHVDVTAFQGDNDADRKAVGHVRCDAVVAHANAMLAGTCRLIDDAQSIVVDSAVFSCVCPTSMCLRRTCCSASSKYRKRSKCSYPIRETC